jgi:glutamate 5-kinase
MTMHPSESRGWKASADRIELFRGVRRVVIKVGTNVVGGSDGAFCDARLDSLAGSLAGLRTAGLQAVLVSSGAVGLGRSRLGLHHARTLDLVTRQACAAVGQALLMHEYEKVFSPRGVRIAQVLLTEDDFMDRRRSSNLRHTMEKLLKLGVVPIVNENDTVSTAELEYAPGAGRTPIFSDNDRLAALVASRLDANALILLTNVEGLLRFSRKSPADDGNSALVPVVGEITSELKALASGPSLGGRGGMLTKLQAAEIASRAGAIAVIADGTRPGILESICRGDPVGTLFLPTARMAGKRRWIAYAADVRGRVVVNPGARAAILDGKASLLWSGVVKVDRRFAPTDVISIADSEGREIARGIANQGSEELPSLTAGKTRGEKAPSGKAVVLVTRNNIVVLGNDR